MNLVKIFYSIGIRIRRKGENMLSSYRTVYIGNEAEIVEKKSRFIASVQSVKTEEEALAFIEKIKKQHWSATHNCFAYTTGERFEVQRCSDDGEPSGTAGKPMLDVILGEKIHNIVVVVTRYFGGTLLGTGGLVRAYSRATQEGIAASTIITKMHGRKLTIGTDYTGLGKIQYILGQRGITILNSEYTDKVSVEVLLPEEEEEQVIAEIVEGTNGRALIEKGSECYFARVDKEMMIFED